MPLYKAIRRRERRFVRPIFLYSIPAAVLMIWHEQIETKICSLIPIDISKLECNAMFHYSLHILTICLIAGLIAATYRFYRDHIRGDAYSEQK